MTELLDDIYIEQFLEWERASRDTIDVKRVYIDLAGDLVSGILLSQIVYWFLPSDEGIKLRVEREGRLWLAKLRTDWWAECRISPKQFDRSIQILKNKGFVELKRFQFRGAIPTLHIWLNISALVQGVTSILTDGENGFYPNVKMEVDQRGKSSTETTNRDYLTEIREAEIEIHLKELLIEISKLPFWIPRILYDDVSWIIDFLSEYPEVNAAMVRECRDHWDGRRAKHKGQWKSRLRNWARKGREIRASKEQPARPRTVRPIDRDKYVSGRYGHVVRRSLSDLPGPDLIEVGNLE